MEYRPLGSTGLSVSVITLGTMTWGEQNTEADGHAQLDRAVDAGVNLVDVAEMYPVPPRAETQGETERIFGTWLAKPGNRAKVLVATKAAGPVRMAHQPKHIRGGTTHLDRANLIQAVDDSLTRLQTDVIDLYQLHWPDRSTNTFGQLGYNAVNDPYTVPIEETLSVLQDIIKTGKIRHVGLSNETPWGFCHYMNLAATKGLPRMASIQNPYNLLNRTFEIGLSEVALRENAGLLAYSPLAFGVLSGKFLGGLKPANARLTLFSRFSRYNSPIGEQATYDYVKLARSHGLDPSQMALAFVNSRPFVTSNIIGATTIEQLEINLGSAHVSLSPEVLAGIEAIYGKYQSPCP